MEWNSGYNTSKIPAEIIAIDKPRKEAPSPSELQAPKLPSVLEDTLQESSDPLAESTSLEFVTTGSKVYALWRGFRIRIQRQQTDELPRNDVENTQVFFKSWA